MIDPFSTAESMLTALRSRQVSAVELLDFELERIERYRTRLNAIVTLDSDRARRSAIEADRKLALHRGTGYRAPSGCGVVVASELPLLGLPLTIKDAIDTAGLATTGGLRRRRREIPAVDAPLVRRLRDAGAVILGKTNIPPYAGDWQTDNALFGRTNNPWDLARTPGGSTGGGAAAVAAGLSPLEFGSDIGGSIRVPAAFCGIYGHRPSDTLIPRSGHFPGSVLPNSASALNVLGPLARSAGDLALALDVVAGPDVGEDTAWRLAMPAARHENLRDFRVAILPIARWAPVSAEIRGAMTQVAECLAAVGAKVEETQPEIFGDLREHHALYASLLAAIFSFGAGTSAEGRRADAEAMLAAGDEISAARAQGLMASADEFLDYHRRREIFRDACRDFFRRWDILLAPVAPTVAFPHDDRPYGERTLEIDGRQTPYFHLAVYPGVATLSGQPATAFPVGLTAEGLPIGLQAIGPYLEDHTPIRFAALVAEELGGYRPPPGFD